MCPVIATTALRPWPDVFVRENVRPVSDEVCVESVVVRVERMAAALLQDVTQCVLFSSDYQRSCP